MTWAISGAGTRADLASDMAEAAELFVDIARRHSGVDWLDYSGDSVRRLDGLISSWWPPHPPRDDYESMVLVIGAYIGCVLCRDTGAVWVVDDGRQEPAVEIPGLGRAFPVSRVARRCEIGEERGITPFFDEVRNYWLSGEEAEPASGRFGKLRRPFER
jgi:hypothetical protein